MPIHYSQLLWGVAVSQSLLLYKPAAPIKDLTINPTPKAFYGCTTTVQPAPPLLLFNPAN